MRAMNWLRKAWRRVIGADLTERKVAEIEARFGTYPAASPAATRRMIESNAHTVEFTGSPDDTYEWVKVHGYTHWTNLADTTDRFWITREDRSGPASLVRIGDTMTYDPETGEITVSGE